MEVTLDTLVLSLGGGEECGGDARYGSVIQTLQIHTPCYQSS